jgi:hypothetical protein
LLRFKEALKNNLLLLLQQLHTQFAYSKGNASATQQTQIRYESAVDAFKRALSEMQIVLDDETAGKFVEKTVTRYIYA